MQTITKFLAGRRYYPTQKRLKLFVVISREGKELTMDVASTADSVDRITINTSLAADEKGAYEYFLYNGLRVTARNLMPLPRVVSAEEEKQVMEAIKQDLKRRGEA